MYFYVKFNYLYNSFNRRHSILYLQTILLNLMKIFMKLKYISTVNICIYSKHNPFLYELKKLINESNRENMLKTYHTRGL